MLNPTEAAPVDPFDLLLNPRRFDLIAKYIYARHRQLGVHHIWADRLYDAHIGAFNNYIEGNPPAKTGIDEFFRRFHDVLDSIGREGFDEAGEPVPVEQDGTPADGAHRIAACALHGVRVPTVGITRSKLSHYSYGFFRRKGLESQWSDAIALEHCRLNERTRIVNLFPVATGRDREIRDILSRVGDIFYEKDVYLNARGAVNYIYQLYEGEPWVEPNRKVRGLVKKARGCFGTSSAPLRVIVLATHGSDDELLQAKQEIRALFNLGNHSIHINDTHAETLAIAGTLFNDNSIGFLNTARLRPFPNFERRFRQYRSWLQNRETDADAFCIDASSILSAYGIRESADLDFLYAGDATLCTPAPDIDLHNDHAGDYPASIDELIYDPANHFWYRGVKFASLDMVRRMKETRGEAKDLEDVAAIHAAERGQFMANWYLLLRQKIRRRARKLVPHFLRRRR